MADVNDIKALIRTAMQKQAASVDSKRSDENEKDVKDAIVASVDSQTAADATGRMEKDPAVNIGTKAEASTDEAIDGVPKETNDDQAFKSASDLQKLAKEIIAGISKAAETAITDEAPENAKPNTDTTDSTGSEEGVDTGEQAGAAAQTTDSAVQTAATKVEEVSSSVAPEADPADGKKEAGVLADEVYKMAYALADGNESNEIVKAAGIEEELAVGDIDSLEDPEADELAAALEASAMDAAGEGTEDADNVADYLEAYQAAPEVLGEGALPGEAALPEEAALAPDVGGGGDIEELLSILQEAGISPEELQGATQKTASSKDSWEGLSKEAKHSVVLDVLKNLNK